MKRLSRLSVAAVILGVVMEFVAGLLISLTNGTTTSQPPVPAAAVSLPSTASRSPRATTSRSSSKTRPPPATQ